jgi:hypothetical protein
LDCPAIFDGSTSNGRNLSNKARSFIRLDDRSRMTGDCHVRICEGLGVRFPRSTRLLNKIQQIRGEEFVVVLGRMNICEHRNCHNI